MWILVIVYGITMNLIGFFAMMIDKRRAKRGAWRIPEKTLFTIAALFGSAGVLLGMKRFRHKTQHKSFVYGIPAILIIQSLFVCMIWYFFFR